MAGSWLHICYAIGDGLRACQPPPPPQPGDRVHGEPMNVNWTAEVVAVDGDHAWVRWDDGSRGTWELSKLRRVPWDVRVGGEQ